MTAGSQHSGQPQLMRQLGLWSAVAVLVGTTIGSGIFRVPAAVAIQLSDPGPYLLAWLVGGLIALCGALSIAELAAAYPRSGGIFAWLLEIYGPIPAFLFGWTELAVVRASALGATATVFAEYVSWFVPLSPDEVRYLAASVIATLGLLNWVGIGKAAVVMNIATFAKFTALVALALLALFASSGSEAHFQPAWQNGVQLSLMASALIPIMWTYDGWADLSFISGEVRNPRRTLPLALIMGTTAIIAVYMLVNVAMIYALPLADMANSPLVATGVAERIPLLVGMGASLIAAMVLVSTFSGLNGSMMTGPRIFFAMAEHGLFFKALARVSPRFQTPSTSIWLATLLGIIYVLHNDFAQLADRFILGIWPFYALAVLGVIILRRKRPHLDRPYRALGYPVVPILFLIASTGLLANALWTDPVGTGVTLLIIAAGLPVYWLWKAWNRNQA